MAKKRFHHAKKAAQHHKAMMKHLAMAKKHEHEGMEQYERGPVKHGKSMEPAIKHHSPAKLEQMADKFNDEFRHEKSPFSFGSYPYDRQELQGGRYSFSNMVSDDSSERASFRSSGIKNEYYAGAEPRRRQEMRDAGMIHEDQRQVANLPQEVSYHPYPVTGPYIPEGLDDTLRGVDRQMDYDDMKRAEHFFPKKY